MKFITSCWLFFVTLIQNVLFVMGSREMTFGGRSTVQIYYNCRGSIILFPFSHLSSLDQFSSSDNFSFFVVCFFALSNQSWLLMTFVTNRDSDIRFVYTFTRRRQWEWQIISAALMPSIFGKSSSLSASQLLRWESNASVLVAASNNGDSFSASLSSSRPFSCKNLQTILQFSAY